MGKDEKVGDPSGYAKSGTEHGHQVALFAGLAQYVASNPALEWMHAVPNGGSRGGDKRSAMIQGAQLKAEGAKAGVLDLAWPMPAHGFHGLMIEMKRPGIFAGSKEQIAYAAYLNANGYCTRLCNHWAQAFRVVEWYGSLIGERAWELPECSEAPFGYAIG